MGDSEYLDFRLLKYIVAIAEAGTFTAAAARLHVSQSALSTQIRSLEENLGIKIFDRDRGTALTSEGKVLVRYGREGLRTRDRIVQTIQAIRAGRITPLRLTFTPFVLNPLLKAVSDLYRELIPDSELVPESRDTDEAIRSLLDDDYDAALVTLPIDSGGLEVRTLEREGLVVCMRNDDPLAAHDAVPALALNEKLSIFTYQKYHPAAHEYLLDLFAKVGIAPRPCKPTMNIDHVQWMVKEGGCYSLVRASQQLVPGLITRPVAETDWTIDTAIACRSGHRNPALALLIEELTKHYPEGSYPPGKRPAAFVTSHEKARQTAVSRVDQLALFSSKSEH